LHLPKSPRKEETINEDLKKFMGIDTPACQDPDGMEFVRRKTKSVVDLLEHNPSLDDPNSSFGVEYKGNPAQTADSR